jgi:hypothetical protein
MMAKALSILVPSAVAVLVVTQWPDIRRYIKIRQMSMGAGHPEYVPAHGRAAYER